MTYIQRRRLSYTSDDIHVPPRAQTYCIVGRNILGHRSIQHTVRYTELSPTRFKDFWR